MKRREFLLSLLATAVPSLPVWAGQSLPVSFDDADSDELMSAAQADKQFTLDLYRRLAAASDDNVILSGHSVMAAFMILAEGTNGPTAAQIGSAFHLPDWAVRSDAREPWNFHEFSQAFAEMQRSMEPIGAEESAALKEELESLTAQQQLLFEEEQRATGPSLIEVQQRLGELAVEIDSLSQRIDPYQLRFANAIWCEKTFPLKADYLASIERHWGAAAFPCDFVNRPDVEREGINDWVEVQTENRIEDLLAPGTIDPTTAFVITNAVYFKGNWASTFDPLFTQDSPFFLPGGGETTVPVMADWERSCRYVELTPDGAANEYQQRGDEWQLAENPDGVKLLELPYRGDRLSMVLVLPNRVDGLAELEAGLTSDQLDAWMNVMREQTVEVFLPRFTMTKAYTLNSDLQALGITAAFQPGGLASMSDAPDARELFISLVAHKAFIEVNEEGTEAAAATAIVAFRGSAVSPRPNPQFRADHPFLYYIQDRETGAILFMGRLTNPNASE